MVSTLKNAMKTGNLPHLLFYGPPGTGKTSAILALAKDMFGKENYKSRVLGTFNASHAYYRCCPETSLQQQS